MNRGRIAAAQETCAMYMHSDLEKRAITAAKRDRPAGAIDDQLDAYTNNDGTISVVGCYGLCATFKIVNGRLVREGVKYLGRTPKTIPQAVREDGHVIVHNRVVHDADAPINVNGFRAWTQPQDHERLVKCSCGWSGLPHYRVRGVGIAAERSEAAMDARARRAAKRAGLKAIKSRGSVHANQRGGFQIVDPYYNRVVAGVSYELSASDVVEIVGAMAARVG